ncbi:MAG: hypothetical protein WDW38_010914 [Sanguina aurantia]
MIAGLPDDLLREICRMASSQSDSSPRPVSRSCGGKLARAPTSGFQALRCSSRRLRDACNSCQSSMSFLVEDQAAAQRFMQKLPHLEAVTIEFRSTTCGISRSLQSLYSVLPRLKSLTLHGTGNWPSSTRMRSRSEGDIGSCIVPWQQTLQRLELHNIRCPGDRLGSDSDVVVGGVSSDCSGSSSTGSVGGSSSTSSRGSSGGSSSGSNDSSGGGGLGFISDLPYLTSLKLQHVYPALQTEHIAGNTHLQQLTLKENKLDTSLDLTSCVSLQEVRVTDYAVQQLDVSGLSQLRCLDCSDNSIPELELSSCLALTRLYCGRNKLSLLNLSTNAKMLELDCRSNPQMAAPVLSGCPLLCELCCAGASFTQLDLTGCAALKVLNLNSSKVHSLELKQACPNLQTLYVACAKNLVSLDLQGMASLRLVNVGCNSSLAALNVVGCARLGKLACMSCPALKRLQVTGCAALHDLSCEECSLQSIDLTACAHLEKLVCSGCPLGVLDLSSCRQLVKVMCARTSITTLDLSASAATLVQLYCKACPLLETVCVSGGKQLRWLCCENCPQLQELDSSGCSSLEYLLTAGSGSFAAASLCLSTWFANLYSV